MKPIAPNTLIQNRYLIVHLIGKGGMGEVYLAVDQRLGSAIALKRTFFSDDILLGNAFEREAKTLARLRHPVLPKVSDHFTDDGTQYLVMEHISGEDMSKRLETAPKPFPLSWVLFWADQLLDALTYLHTHEPPIIHRDIKPQNLKLTDENHIVLLDFGLSKNSTGETRATTSGSSIVGYTPHYAPMEQIRGTGTDARSDVYSLSATLYQILTGSVPPDALTRADSLINGLPDPVTPISDINTEVSRGVSDVIIKGMAISQEQRYKTAREMQKALRDAYAQMQNETQASTIEYSGGSQPAILEAQQKSEPAASLPLGQKTEILPFPAHISQTPLSSPPTPTVSDSFAAANQHSSVPPSTGNGSAAPPPDFDATLRYDGSVEDIAPKQADIRTEVFLAGNSSVIADAIAESTHNSYAKKESFDREIGKSEKIEENLEESKFFSEADLKGSPGYSPDATVPLMSFDNGAGANAAKFDSFSEKKKKESTFTPAGTSIPGEQVKTAASVKPKSSKTLLIVGGLAALLILAVGAGAVGWFVMRDSGGKVENATPKPTPEASVTVQPTVEMVNDANANSNVNGLTNSDIGTTNANNPANIKTGNISATSPTAAPSKTVQPTPMRPVATPRQTPVVNIETSRPATPKPTPKKTPPPIVQ